LNRVDEMLKVKIECRNVGCEKVANCLEKFGKTFPFGHKVWLYDGRVFAYFKLRSFSDLNEFIKRFKRIKVEFFFHRIQKVWI
jgi:hypothetical protein